MREPTAEQCRDNEVVAGPRGEPAFACWYPQMGGYVAKCVVVPGEPDEDGGSCFDARVWHDGEFPFGDEAPRVLHHCSARQFVEFGQLVLSRAKSVSSAPALPGGATLDAELVHHLRVVLAAIGGELATETGRARWSAERGSVDALAQALARLA